jgi:hypothetical protein
MAGTILVIRRPYDFTNASGKTSATETIKDHVSRLFTPPPLSATTELTRYLFCTDHILPGGNFLPGCDNCLINSFEQLPIPGGFGH